MDYELKEKMYMNEKDCVMGVVLFCVCVNEIDMAFHSTKSKCKLNDSDSNS